MRPQLWCIAGPNGCGKSTLVDKHLVGRIPVVNADNILRADPNLGLMGAGRKAIEQQNALLQQRDHFAWETTLSGRRELKFLQAAKDAGYKVNLIYVSVQEPFDSIQRVATGYVPTAITSRQKILFAGSSVVLRTYRSR